MARVAILEDETMVAHMMRDVIHTDGSHEVVLLATSGKAFRTRWPQAEADIVLLDLVLPDCDGLELIEEVVGFRSNSPPVLVVSGAMSRATVRRVLRSKVRGYFDKFSRPSRLVAAIDDVLAGGRPISTTVAAVHRQTVASGQVLDRILTPTEVRLVPLLSLGLSNREIGVRSSISESTVQTHRRNIMEKLEVDSSTQLMCYGIEHGIVQQRSDGSLSAPPW